MKRHALFVGVDQYADAHIQDLRCAVNDATELAGFFKHRARFDRAEALANPRNCEAILDRVYDMISGLGAGDEFLFFFAGHGIKTQDGHRLVCAGDKLNAVKHSWAGLPLERIKSETSGAFNRLFLLDACRTDVLATNRGVAGAMEKGTRDLILGAATSADQDVGALTILCSCNDGECAGEILKHRHGLFSMAMLELLDEECSCGRRVLVTDDFVYNQIPARMRALAEKSDMAFNQKPQKEGPPILLLDGLVVDGTMPVAGSLSTTPVTDAATTAPELVDVCPVCGKTNKRTETFKCSVCGKGYMCLDHQSANSNCCRDCACITAFENEQFKEAYDLSQDADLENAHIQFIVGRCLERLSSYEEAVKWFRKSAEQGFAEAQNSLGRCYYCGYGVVLNSAEGIKWYLKAAEQGHADAQLSMGLIYEDKEDYVNAAIFYQKAADQEVAEAQYRLGNCYEFGHGVKQDMDKALEWYRKAAKLGNKYAIEEMVRLKDVEARKYESMPEINLITEKNHLAYFRTISNDENAIVAYHLWRNGKFTASIERLRECHSNDPYSDSVMAYCMAMMYKDDKWCLAVGVKKDLHKSFLCMVAAAEGGNAVAMYDLSMVDTDLWLENDESMSDIGARAAQRDWLAKAAGLKYEDAICEMAKFYAITQPEESLRWLRFGVEHGSIKAARCMAEAIDDSPGKWPMNHEDFEKLVSCLSMSDPLDCYHIGRIHEKGLDGKKDVIRAKWYYERSSLDAAKKRLNSFLFKVKLAMEA